MPRFSPSERVEWVSRSGIRREGAVVEELPSGQWAVKPDGGGVEVAVDKNDLSKVQVVVAPPVVAPRETSPRRTVRAAGNRQHGTRALYKRGCRCAPCTAANRDYNRESRRKSRRGGAG